MKTLAELNAAPYRYNWNNYVIETTRGVGRTGSSRLGTSGAKFHVVIVGTVVGYVDDNGEKRMPIGRVFEAYGACNGNGQVTARVVPGKDTDAVTCSKCLARYEGR